MPKARPATDIREVQVIKDDRTFLLTDRYGDAPDGNTAALGLYHDDTRFLSRLELTVEGIHPILLHSSTERNYSQLVELAYPVTSMDPTGVERKENLSIQRSRVLSGTLHERVRVRNFGKGRRRVRLALEFDADFLDIFEVRGLAREQRGQAQQPRVDRNQVVLAYRGLDGETRSTTLRFSPAPAELTASSAIFELEVESGRDAEIAIEVAPEVGSASVERRSMQETEDRLARDYTAFRKRCTRFKTSNAQLSQFLDRAILDLRMLTSTTEDGASYIDAGVP